MLLIILHMFIYLQAALASPESNVTLQVVGLVLQTGVGCFVGVITSRISSIRRHIEKIEDYLVRRDNLPPGIL